jgi:hypothetical protein
MDILSSRERHLGVVSTRWASSVFLRGCNPHVM